MLYQKKRFPFIRFRWLSILFYIWVNNWIEFIQLAPDVIEAGVQHE